MSRGLMYVRHFSPVLDAPWQQVFNTESKQDVEAFCRAQNIDWEWLGDDSLKTRQLCQSVLQHPITKYWAQQCPEHWQPVGLVYQQQSHGVTGDMVEITSACDETFVQNLSSFCRQHEVTEETVLITAWASVLRRLSLDYGQDGTMTPLGWVHDCRRDYEELANTWGMFSRPLPLPWQAIAEESFLAAVERMQNQQEAASEWQEYYAIEADAKSEHGRFGFEWGNSPDSTEVGTSGANTIAQIIANTHSSIRIAGVKAFSQNFDLLLLPELLVPTEKGGTKEEALKEGCQGNLVLRLSYDTRCYSDLSARVLLEQYQSFLLAALATPTKRGCESIPVILPV